MPPMAASWPRGLPEPITGSDRIRCCPDLIRIDFSEHPAYYGSHQISTVDVAIRQEDRVD
jgi:hypothetical protein